MAETLLLPYPPSVNHYWRTFRGRTLVSKEGREYRSKIVAALGIRKPLQGDIAIKIDVYPPDKRRRDLDNVLKSLLDGLAHGGVYEDDSQIGHIDLLRCCVAPPGRVVVAVEPLNH